MKELLVQPSFCAPAISIDTLEIIMPTIFFLVRAVVAEPLREKFDHWTSTDHLPRALADFKAEK